MGTTRNGKPGVVIGTQNIDLDLDLDLTVDSVSDRFSVMFDFLHALFVVGHFFASAPAAGRRDVCSCQ
jgi:hypothetical protein